MHANQLPAYEIRDGVRIVAEAIGYEATIEAVDYLLTSGEEDGPLGTYRAGDRRDRWANQLETFRLEDGAVIVATTQGLRAVLA